MTFDPNKEKHYYEALVEHPSNYITVVVACKFLENNHFDLFSILSHYTKS